MSSAVNFTPQALRELAIQTITANDQGGYTIPTHGLYPFQWNWDSGITALGIAQTDEARAWLEFETLFQGQWRGEGVGANAGFLPHIVFHQHSDGYFPNETEWGCATQNTPPTSSITQPPLHATMVRWLYETARDKTLAAEKVKQLLPNLIALHQWFYRARDPQGTGLVATIHPWETGMDNSPAWDAPLANVPPTQRAYTRKDLKHGVDPSQRPPQSFYDRAVYLLDFNKSVNFDPAQIPQHCPYWVADIGIVCILHRASRDLVSLCQTLGFGAEAEQLKAKIKQTEVAIQAAWSEELGQFISLDLRAAKPIQAATHAGLLSLYAGLGTPAQQARTAESIAQLLAQVKYGVPSTRPSQRGYEPQRYWRGPVWAHMNLLIARGLSDYGFTQTAEQIKTQTLSLFSDQGFWEYYHPETGAGLGGKKFSWTAASYLWWVKD